MILAPAERALFQRFKNEPRFAIENLFKIELPEKREIGPLRYNEAQVKLQNEIEWFRKRDLPVRLWICKSRRAGMSTVCEANIFHDTIFTPRTRSLIAANQNKPAENILRMCHRFWQNLPDALRPPLPPEYKGRPSKDRMPFETIGSEMLIATAKSVDQYLGFGLNNFHGTEVARWDRGSELMTAIYPALTSGGPKSMFFGESTPFGQGNFFHEQCMLAHESQGRHGGQHGGFRLLFVPWHELRKTYSSAFPTPSARDQFEKRLNDVEKSLVARFKVSLEQLNWRRGMLSGPPFDADEDLFDQEYPSDLETAFLSQGKTVISRKALLRLTMNKRRPEWVGDIYWGDSSAKNRHESDYDLVRRPQILTRNEARIMANGRERFECTNNDGDYGALHIWRKPVRGDRCVIACDVGGGNPDTKGGGDYSTMVLVAHNVFGPDEVLATWKARIIPVNFAVLASAFAWWVRNRTGDETPPLLAPEWNGTGVPMNMHIENRKLYQPHFRYFAPGVRGTPDTNHVGWESNGKTKRMGIGYMQQWIENGDIDVPDERIIVELASFKEFMGADGESAFGGEGAHDDMVAPLYIAASCIYLGKITGNPEPQRVMSDYPTGAQDDGEPFDRAGDRGMYAAHDEDDEEYEYAGGGAMDWG